MKKILYLRMRRSYRDEKDFIRIDAFFRVRQRNVFCAGGLQYEIS